jgi:hypothetical protein
MLYARVNKQTDEVLEFPITERELRDNLVNTTLPRNITEMSLSGTEYVCVPATPSAEVDLVASFDFKVMPTAAVKNSEGKWERVYTLVEVPEEIKFARLARRWAFVRNKRNEALAALDWKVLRNLREQRLGLPTTDNIAELDAKMQMLADITNTDNPFVIDISQF